MKINIKYLDNNIEIKEDKINIIEIENKNYFYRIVSDFNNISNGLNNDNIILFDKDLNEININNSINIIYDYFNFDLYFKKCNIAINKKLNLEIDEENKKEIIQIYKKLLSKFNKSLKNIDLPLIINNELSFESILKHMKLNIKYYNNLLENLLLIIDLEKELKINKLIIFINLKSYLNNKELEELYKYSIYNNIKIILIDSKSYGISKKYEEKLLIDEDLTEFML